MARFFPAESTKNDPEVFAFVVDFPSGARKSVSWKQSAPVVDSLECAKACASQLVQSLLNAGLQDDIDRTNWASATAAIQKLITDWNEARRDALYADAPPQVVH